MCLSCSERSDVLNLLPIIQKRSDSRGNEQADFNPAVLNVEETGKADELSGDISQAAGGW